MGHLRRAPLAGCWAVMLLAACSDSPPVRPDLRDGPALPLEGGAADRAIAEAGAPDRSLAERRAVDGRPAADAPVRDRSAGDAAQPSSCPAANLQAGNHNVKLTFGGLQREYDLHVPASLKSGVAAPLVVDFHGFTSDKDQQRFISGFLAESDLRGFAVAWPNGWGTQQSWNAGATCCGTALNQKLDDIGLAKAIVQKIASSICIDPRRVYATGLSNGGMLSHRIGCEGSSIFAAVAPVAGRIDLVPMTACQPGRPVAVIAFHGMTDPLVPYNNATASIARWVEIDGCTDAGTVTFTKGKSSCKTYSTCKAGVKVSLCSLDAGHVSYTNADQVAIAPLAWDFLKGFSLP